MFYYLFQENGISKDMQCIPVCLFRHFCSATYGVHTDPNKIYILLHFLLHKYPLFYTLFFFHLNKKPTILHSPTTYIKKWCKIVYEYANYLQKKKKLFSSIFIYGLVTQLITQCSIQMQDAAVFTVFAIQSNAKCSPVVGQLASFFIRNIISTINKTNDVYVMYICMPFHEHNTSSAAVAHEKWDLSMTVNCNTPHILLQL